MKKTSTSLYKILTFTVMVEVVTSLVLLIDPTFVITLLLGTEVSGVGTSLGRCFGIALLALCLACWPNRLHAESSLPSLRAMLAYNTLIALYLAYLGMLEHFWGLLLWPAVVLHAIVSLLLVWRAIPGKRIIDR